MWAAIAVAVQEAVFLCELESRAAETEAVLVIRSSFALSHGG
jgi:hypothetical protein